jgi:sugar/nucleoside kinase (ribokinase family)
MGTAAAETKPTSRILAKRRAPNLYCAREAACDGDDRTMPTSAPEAADLDVIGLGNAIVDVLCEADDRSLDRLDLAKGTMTLVDEARMTELYGGTGPAVEVSGGSCANTMAALASLGAKVAYVGKVQRDQLGEVFTHDIRASGVEFRTPPLDTGPPTARCVILVTPDAQRTMATYLGACVELGPDDVDESRVAAARIIYLEGYLWDRPEAKAACLKAAELAHRHKRRVALTLSDPFCVARWREEFAELIARHVDVLIANEVEICSLYGANTFEDVVDVVRGQVDLAALTRGAEGSVIVAPEQTHVLPAAPIGRLVDTTGAGDLYAAGLLYGLTHDLPLAACGRLGSLSAAHILGHYGARASGSLKPLVEAAKRVS